jgi:uncharacterized protein
MKVRHSQFVVLAGLALASCSDAEDPRGVDRDEVLVQVAASGRADTRPDEARFTAGVETIAATAAAASTRNNEVINRVVAALRRLGVNEQDVQTRSITLSRIDYGQNRGRFQANNMIDVRVRNLGRAGHAIAATTEAGANVLSGPHLRIADPEAASRSAYASAFRAARARAEAYAGAAGLRVTRVLAIRDAGEVGVPPPYYGDMNLRTEQAAAPVAPPPPPVLPGQTVSEVRIRVDFALAE